MMLFYSEGIYLEAEEYLVNKYTTKYVLLILCTTNGYYSIMTPSRKFSTTQNNALFLILMTRFIFCALDLLDLHKAYEVTSLTNVPPNINCSYRAQQTGIIQ